jgi:AraC-like DNA-binding protein
VQAFGGRDNALITDEFEFLRQAYGKAQASPGAGSASASTSEILVAYGLRRLMEPLSGLEPADLSWAKDSGIRVDLNAQLSAAILWFETNTPRSQVPGFLTQLADALDGQPSEVVTVDEHSLVVLSNGHLDTAIQGLHAAWRVAGVAATVVLAEGPCPAAQLPQSLNAAWSALRTLRLHRPGEFALASQLQISRKHELLVQTMQQMLRAQYHDAGLSVEHLAGLLKMSHHYLARIFKEWTGQTVHEALSELRLEHAARLLLAEGSPSIKQVMALVGFDNESSFYRGFKAKFGMTPKEYVLQGALRSIEGQNSPLEQDSQA